MPIITPQGATPTGAAGGDLTGTYPSPTISPTLTRFAPQLAGLVSSDGPSLLQASSLVTGTANDIKLVRVTVPYTGTLHGLSVFVGTQSGNISLAVYDTGQAAANTWTRLYTSGAIACAAAGAWQTVDPALAVTVGQQVLFALSFDNATAAFGCLVAGAGGMAQLPASFLSTPDGSQALGGRISASHPAPATLSPAAVIGVTAAPFLIARVA